MSASSSSASFPEAARAAAVIVAGGSGRRMGGVRKQYLDILGEPILARATRPFLDHPQIGPVIVVLPAEDLVEPPRWLVDLPVTLAAGGAERGESVWNGLALVPADAEVVLIHDGARPFVTADLIGRVVEGARRGGMIAAIPSVDTMKQVSADGVVERTLPRARIWQAQTPQGFPLKPLVEAYRRARLEGWAETDDASVFERCGLSVGVTEGDRENIKITRPSDLPIAEAIARHARSGAAESPLRER